MQPSTAVLHSDERPAPPLAAEPDRSGAAAYPRIARLTLTDFRCYGQVRLAPDAPVVVLTGPNGAGKTNLLEAVSLLVPGRGLRRAPHADLVRAGAEGGTAAGWAVAATLATARGSFDIGTGETGDGGRRQVRIGGETARSQAALGEIVSAQWLTPQMDGLFQEGPGARRRFLDRLVYGRDGAHAGRIQRYEKAMRERAHLLKEKGEGADARWLTALEDTMGATGVAIAAARLEAAGRLAGELKRRAGAANGGRTPFPSADIAVEGEVEALLATGSALEAEDALKAALLGARRQDAETGRTAHGPHRSDLKVFFGAGGGQIESHGGRPAALCSTGEQKALLISLVLAQASLQAREGLGAPLLLLDEVAAHLDEDRRHALFAEIEGLGGQTWLTGTDRAAFEPLGDVAAFFRVEHANVRPEE